MPLNIYMNIYTIDRGGFVKSLGTVITTIINNYFWLYRYEMPELNLVFVSTTWLE